MRVIALVDFDNDSVGASLAVARAMGSRLWGVRLDTSADLVDRSLDEEMGDFDPRGVNPRLVERVRNAPTTLIVTVMLVPWGVWPRRATGGGGGASGGAVESYGDGAAGVRGSFDYTADVVRVEGAPLAKVGRWYRENDRLERVT